MSKQRVVVAMSGGVDSSVVAAILKQEGYDVVGVTLQLYDYGKAVEKQKACCASRDIHDAFEVSQKIGIPHYTFNYESAFKSEVIDKFVDSYLEGYTPIPCVNCNQTVKFRDLYKISRDLNADFLATGHYVRRVEGSDGAELWQGLDKTKDQSYFLFATTKEQLDFLRFPLGNKTKEETRQIASELGLPVSNKPDSQDICFVPNGDYRKVIEKHRPDSNKMGDLVDFETGKVIGAHSGIVNFTIGQRKGLGVNSLKPLFVIKIDASENKVFLGEEKHLFKDRFVISDFNLLCDKDFIENQIVEVKLRSAHKPVPARISFQDNTALVSLLAPQRAITPGQACVFYTKERLLGGGWIKNIL